MHIRTITLFALGALCSAPAVPVTVAQAQERVEQGQSIALPREVVREVAEVWNAPGTRRERGPFTLPADETVNGDLAVLGGPAMILGVVTGQLVVINGDATLGSNSRVDGKVTVVGGTLDRAAGTVRGDIRAWRARLRYREVDGELIPEPESEFAIRWQRWRRGSDEDGLRAELFLTTAHTYNRVEGLPIYVGPRLRMRTGDTRVDVELYGIFRTGEDIEWKRENLGHRARIEVRQGSTSGVALGARLFDEVDAVERWQLTDGEVGLASFLFTRDYRDYWNRHGGQGYLRAFANRRSSISVGYGEERWQSRGARDPWTIFNSGIDWRVNPAADEGLVKLVTVDATFDTRNSTQHPRTGWYLTGRYERGSGDLLRATLFTPDSRPATPEAVEYGRAFLDLRRYNRLAPGAQLNLRAVAGGWVHGDLLPQQRRLSVSGVDALPGYDFRRLLSEEFDVGTCVAMSNESYATLGRPANCQRIMLLQAEWKGDFRIGLFGDRDYGDRRWYTSGVHADGTWVVFVNSGRGWGESAGSTPDAPRITGLPPINTWRTDLGGGLDLGNIGVYVAKAVTHGGEPLNFFVRLGRRF